ncbi:hypothetical protein ACHHV8_36140 [Paenibacillus sp. TAB 01]|uniref:hypothetical protein n=1 Tax=Paenibacillus sp. TAB 01 TaxID=3368988 RepID=UPI003750B3F6
MKAVLYAVVDGEMISWQVTLDVRADVAYWLGRQKNPERILMLDPALSFGQAILLKEKMNRLIWNVRYVREGKSSWSAFYQHVLERLHKEAADLIKQWKEQGQ